jgi:hypothetical protein
VVTEQLTFEKLSNIKSSKAPGLDTIPGWVLKENANILALCKILNSSYHENRLPSSWKMADVRINKDLRPISLTPIISKLAEEVVVEQFIKPAILKVMDSNQFGTVPKSSTHALITRHILTYILGGHFPPQAPLLAPHSHKIGPHSLMTNEDELFFFVFFPLSFIGHTYKRLHIIIQTKKITGYTSNGASANGTTRPMQGATPKLN